MRKCTFWVLIGILLIFSAAISGCAASRLTRRSSVTVTPTRTPRPTWTPAAVGLAVATPTLDPTRFPGLQPRAALPATPQVLVPGSNEPIFVPLPGPGSSGVQTVVVIIVTATPPPSPTPTPLPPTETPGPTATPGPPTVTPTPSQTPPPPVVVTVKADKTRVRSGPGTAYPQVAQLDAGTQITVVGRNRAGTWWKVCCVNGSDVWIADSMVTVTGPVWMVAEVTNIPAPPPPPPTKVVPPTPAPTPTFAWPFRVENKQAYPSQGDNILRVNAIIYNGAVPLWGYKLKVRRLSTGQEWLSDGSQALWYWEPIQFPKDGKRVVPSFDCPVIRREGLQCVKYNVKWDSNQVSVPPGDDAWEITATDGGGQPISAPVRLETNSADPRWHYIVFTNRP